MSASSVVTIWCDEPDCPEWFTNGQPGAIDTRKAARKYGWRRAGGRDICPTCVKTALSVKPVHA